jgi:hypothetical protein
MNVDTRQGIHGDVEVRSCELVTFSVGVLVPFAHCIIACEGGFGDSQTGNFNLKIS